MNLEQVLTENIKLKIGEPLESVFSPQFISYLHKSNEEYVKEGKKFKNKEELLRHFWWKANIGDDNSVNPNEHFRTPKKLSDYQKYRHESLRARLIRKVGEAKGIGISSAQFNRFSVSNLGNVRHNTSEINKVISQLIKEGIIVEERRFVLSKIKIRVSKWYILFPFQKNVETNEQFEERYLRTRMEASLRKHKRINKSRFIRNLFHGKGYRKIRTVLDQLVKEGKVRLEVEKKPHTSSTYLFCVWVGSEH